MAGHLGHETVNFTHGLVEKLPEVDPARVCQAEAALAVLFTTAVGICSLLDLHIPKFLPPPRCPGLSHALNCLSPVKHIPSRELQDTVLEHFNHFEVPLGHLQNSNHIRWCTTAAASPEKNHPVLLPFHLPTPAEVTPQHLDKQESLCLFLLNYFLEVEDSNLHRATSSLARKPHALNILLHCKVDSFQLYPVPVVLGSPSLTTDLCSPWLGLSLCTKTKFRKAATNKVFLESELNEKGEICWDR